MRRLTAAAIAIPLACLAVYGGLWLWAAHALTAGFDRWKAQLQAQGWTAEAGMTSTTGFPFSVALALGDARLEGGSQSLPGGVSWQATRVVISVSMASPLTLSVAPDGEQRLRLANMPLILFHADRMEARLPLWQGRRRSASLEAAALVGGIAGSHHPQDVRLESLALSGSAQPGPANGLDAQLHIAMRQLELPDTGRWPMGAVISELGGVFDVYSPRLARNEARAAAAAAWQKAGGKVALHDALLQWGPMTLRGNAVLTLDSHLQPAGSGIVTMTGGADAFDALVNGGVLQKGVGATAKAVLSVMAPVSDGRGVQLPFTLRDSTISVGPIPIARLRDVIW